VTQASREDEEKSRRGPGRKGGSGSKRYYFKEWETLPRRRQRHWNRDISWAQGERLFFFEKVEDTQDFKKGPVQEKVPKPILSINNKGLALNI